MEQYLAHGATQGFVSQLRGQSFRSGFISGFAGKVAGGLTSKMGFTGTTGADRFGSTTIAAVFGGLASQATGGDFTEGAMRAAFVHLYNELAELIKDEHFKMQFRYAKNSYDAYVATAKRQEHEKFIKEYYPHAVDLMQSHEQSEYYQSRLKPHKFAKPIVTGPSTGDVVGFGLSVAAAFGTGGWSYFLGASTIAIDVFQGDPYGTLIGGAALTTWKPATVGDITYGGCRLSSECSETLDIYLP